VTRPWGVSAPGGFFVPGMVVRFPAVSMAFPGGFLEPMWRLYPRARETAV
jgi:hypothetical protein